MSITPRCISSTEYAFPIKGDDHMMIVAQSKGDIDAWALHDQASMEEASLRGAEIFQIDKGTKTILFDGEKWVKDKPDFFQLRHKAFFASM